MALGCRRKLGSMVSKWVKIKLITGVYWGYNPLTNHLLSSWDIQAVIHFPFLARARLPKILQSYGAPSIYLVPQTYGTSFGMSTGSHENPRRLSRPSTSLRGPGPFKIRQVAAVFRDVSPIKGLIGNQKPTDSMRLVYFICFFQINDWKK